MAMIEYSGPQAKQIHERGHMNIRGPQLFYSFFHTVDESSSYWRSICGLELYFVVFVFNNQCFNVIYVCELLQKCIKFACNYF